MNSYSPSERSVTFRDLCRVLFRHKKKAAAVFLLILTSTVLYLTFAPRKYLSESRLFVRVGRESVSLDPTATMGEVIAVDTTRAGELNSVMQVLKSRVLLEKVVDHLGPEAILGSAPSSSPADREDPLSRAMNSLRQFRHRINPVSERETAVTELEGRMHFDLAKDSSVISISCKASDPARAQQLLAAFVDVFLQEHMRLNRTQGSYVFFENQSTLLREELKQASHELRDAKNAFGLVSAEAGRQILQGEIAEIETEMIRTRPLLDAANMRIEVLDSLMKDLPEHLVMQEETLGFGNQATDYMRQQLYELEIKERELLARYTDDHPLVAAARQQLQDVKRIFTQQPGERTQSRKALSPVREKLHLDLLTQVADGASLKAKQEALVVEHQRIRTRLEELNGHELRLAELDRKVAILDSNYRICMDKREESRVDEALQGERITNVNIIQPASLVERADSPRMKMILVLGLAAAFSLALTVALAAEYLSRSFATPADVEEGLGIPVLATIPKTSRRHVLVS